MTKAEEIKLLDDIIERAPKRSYLRTTLKELRVQFESDIRSDFETMPNLAQMEKERLQIMGEIRARQLTLAGLETKVQNLRAERGRIIGALNGLERQTLEIQNTIRVVRKDWENLSL